MSLLLKCKECQPGHCSHSYDGMRVYETEWDTCRYRGWNNDCGCQMNSCRRSRHQHLHLRMLAKRNRPKT